MTLLAAAPGSTLNVAAVCSATGALGPGLRAVAWVQGCPLRCPQCLAPEWIPDVPARALTPAELAAELLADPRVDGLTFSGGEPMAQAAGLARTVALAREARPELSLVCFTGFTLGRLRRQPPGPGVPDLLDQVDVLIDGAYRADLNVGRGLRGSTNQRIHHLTDRLRDNGFDFADGARTVEVRIGTGEAFLIGVPPPGALAAVLAALEPSTLGREGGR